MLQNLTDNQAILEQSNSMFLEVMVGIMIVSFAIYLYVKRKREINDQINQ